MSSYLPPTSNFLDQEDRARLIKSTRKLEAVLGVAPHLLEGDRPSLDAIRRSSDESSRSSYDEDDRLRSLDIPSRSSSRASNRSARVSSSARASFISFDVESDSEDESDFYPTPEVSPTEAPKATLTLLPLHVPIVVTEQHQAKRLKKSIEPSLFLQLHAPVHPYSMTSNHSTTTDVLTAMPLSPLSPLSPTMANIEPDVESRRRKMAAKLTRTLGENIPPELVYTPAPVTARPRTRARSSSIDDRHFSAQLPKRPSVKGAFTPAPVDTRAPSQMYETVTIQILRNIGKYYASESSDEVHDLRPSAARQRSTGANLTRSGSARARGKGWSGEWNHEMEDVMSKLRTLKA